jgi:hypothetical protein
MALKDVFLRRRDLKYSQKIEGNSDEQQNKGITKISQNSSIIRKMFTQEEDLAFIREKQRE